MHKNTERAYLLPMFALASALDFSGDGINLFHFVAI